MSSISTNLALIARVSQFISTKLENAKSAKDSMTDQQQNSDNITDSFDVSEIHQQALLSKASFNKVSSSNSKTAELPAFYQHLDCSHVNIQTWHHCMCHMSMYKILKLCQIAKDIDIDDMSVSKQLCEVCIQDKSHKHVSKAF